MNKLLAAGGVLLIPKLQLLQVQLLGYVRGRSGHPTDAAHRCAASDIVAAAHELVGGGEVKVVLSAVVTWIFLDTLHGDDGGGGDLYSIF